ncbi:hypothetical protein LY78DRAFT_673135 [Colletotrichum sublineola]|nr:hypothetical protein LY78DRAFT_673135 [Colletotrichum sublineola]
MASDVDGVANVAVAAFVGKSVSSQHTHQHPPEICRNWVAIVIAGIKDVTARARELERVLEERPGIGDGELINLGLLPAEKEFKVPTDVEEILEMNLSKETMWPRQA